MSSTKLEVDHGQNIQSVPLEHVNCFSQNAHNCCSRWFDLSSVILVPEVLTMAHMYIELYLLKLELPKHGLVRCVVFLAARGSLRTEVDAVKSSMA